MHCSLCKSYCLYPRLLYPGRHSGVKLPGAHYFRFSPSYDTPSSDSASITGALSRTPVVRTRKRLPHSTGLEASGPTFYSRYSHREEHTYSQETNGIFSLLPANSSRMGIVTSLDSYHRPVMAFALQGTFVGGLSSLLGSGSYGMHARLHWRLISSSSTPPTKASRLLLSRLRALLYYCFLDQNQSDRWRYATLQLAYFSPRTSVTARDRLDVPARKKELYAQRKRWKSSHFRS